MLSKHSRRGAALFVLLSVVALPACGGPTIVMRQPSHNLLLMDDDEIRITFDEAATVVGQPCSCVAAGFSIARHGLDALDDGSQPIRSELRLVASRDHAITDVVAYILGIERRYDLSRNGFRLDPDLSEDRGVWRFLIVDPHEQRAVEVTFYKWRLMEEPVRRRLQAIEERAEHGHMSEEDRADFQQQMEQWVQILLDPVDSRQYVEARSMDFEQVEAAYPELTAHHHHK